VLLILFHIFLQFPVTHGARRGVQDEMIAASADSATGAEAISVSLATSVKIAIVLVEVLFSATLCARAQTPSELLDQADSLAESFNLTKAQPLYHQAETAARLAGDVPEELRAKLGQIRFRVQQGSYKATREELREILVTPLVLNDSHLKIRVLEILGNIDLNQNTSAALNDWTEMLATAKSLADTKWINRANGYLGIVSGLHGDIGSAGKALFQALGTAEKSGDIPGELTFGIWLANGMSTNGMADGAVHLLDRVEASAKKSGYTELPIQFSIAKIRALTALGADQGRDQAKALLRVTLADARRQEIPGAQTDLLSQAGQIAMEEQDSRSAEESFAEQVRLPKKPTCRAWKLTGYVTCPSFIDPSGRTPKRNSRSIKESKLFGESRNLTTSPASWLKRPKLNSRWTVRKTPTFSTTKQPVSSKAF
jgi:hypothetical protein